MEGGSGDEGVARLALILAYTSSVGTFNVYLACILDLKIFKDNKKGMQNHASTHISALE